MSVSLSSLRLLSTTSSSPSSSPASGGGGGEEEEDEEGLLAPFYAFSDHKWGWSATQAGISSYFTVFLSLLSLALVTAHYLELAAHVGKPRSNVSRFSKQYAKYALGRFMPEAGSTILIGVLAGALIKVIAVQTSSEEDDHNLSFGLLGFSSTVFFVALLPPIIFSSGYHLRRQLFFANFRGIVALAIAGTTISTIIVACLLYACVYSADLAGLKGDSFQPQFIELLAFGALISATDPVSTLAVFAAKKVHSLPLSSLPSFLISNSISLLLP
jgi:hypothetical protein